MNIDSGLRLELGNYQNNVDTQLELMHKKNFVNQFWNKEEDLWLKENVQSEIADLSMGWLNVIDKMLVSIPMIEEFCETIRSSGFEHIVLLGMGGSSMAPLVFQKTFCNKAKGVRPPGSKDIKFTVLDTTDPATIKKVEKKITISTTLFIVSSKSGTTAEVTALYKYFNYRVSSVKGEKAGENFIAITDGGSALETLAQEKNFRKIFINFTDIGGRYSALSYFGIVPAALMGINVKEILVRALAMMNSCGPLVPISKNPGVVLGVAIAELALQGCDKLTYLISPELKTFGLWLEQLIAESTGKDGKGILPLNGNPLTQTNSYGRDRFFVNIECKGKKNHIQSELKKFILMDYPLINILIKDKLDIGKEFFRWEIATATAGSILEVNPFDQPNVQESKKVTDLLLKNVEKGGKLQKIKPTATEKFVDYYAMSQESSSAGNIDGKKLMEDILLSVKEGDYIALQAYLPQKPKVEDYFLEMQQYLQNTFNVAVTTEFGPRYLHSTGQYHKGGPNKGVFIQFICNSPGDIQIPEYPYTFGSLKRAQAMGDREALVNNNRRVILVDLGKDLVKGLNSFKQIIEMIEPKKEFIIEPLPVYHTIETPSSSIAAIPELQAI
jgi:transaldolase/glucose-6-phosphate isomerase